MTIPHLGSCSLTLHFNIALPPRLFIINFLDHSFPLLYNLLPTRRRSSLKLSCLTRSPPTLPVKSAAHTVLVGTSESINLEQDMVIVLCETIDTHRRRSMRLQCPMMNTVALDESNPLNPPCRTGNGKKFIIVGTPYNINT